MTFTKSLGAKVKSASDDGVVEAIVATYDLDSVGDKILPGAFRKTLGEWKSSGGNIPFIWSHMHTDPDAYIGEITEAKETDDGLWVKAQVDMDHAPAKRIFDLMKRGSVTQFSFAYDVKEGAFVQKKDDEDDGPGGEYYELRELKLFEAGPCLIGANQNTRLLGAKREEMKDGKQVEGELKSFDLDYDKIAERVAEILSKKDSTGDTDDKRDERNAKREQGSSPKDVLISLELAELEADNI